MKNLLLLILAIMTIQPSFSSENQRPFVFSYAACSDISGRADLRSISAGVAWTKMEADTIALNNTQIVNGCGRSPKIVESALITSQEQSNYCVAACVGYDGADNSSTLGRTGRNLVEAKFNALHDAQIVYGCGRDVMLVSCE